MKVREPTTDDIERIRELARSTMTASYSLSPQQIDIIIDEQFEEGRMTDLLERDEGRLFVLEDEEWETIVGFAESHLDGESGELRWLFVDPEHRGRGLGEELFEMTTEKLREDGAEEIHAKVLEANREGSQFLESSDFKEVDSRQVEYGDESFVEYRYVPDSTGTDSDRAGDDAEIDPAEMTLENTETHDGVTTATTDDGRTVYLNRDQTKSGTESPFFVTYSDQKFEDRFGYYCSNCGSLETTRDAQDHIECVDCGNVHTPKSAESYDGSYL